MRSKRLWMVACAALLALAMLPLSAVGQTSGAIFTTESACDGTNVNIFDSKSDVYLDGGPAHTGAAGLDPGSYYIRVTEPNGTLLGSTTTPSVTVLANGEFAQCYQLEAILVKASDASPGYDDTSNAGGEYKVWASKNSTFPNNESKTDNFKVLPCTENCQPEEPPPSGTITVRKFYDKNANGLDDDSLDINGWRIDITDGTSYVRYTPVSITVQPDDYTVTESTPIETNWVHTASFLNGTAQSPLSKTVGPFTVANGDTDAVVFGNLCLGAGGGHTLGFWSNKNGQATMNDGPAGGSPSNNINPELALLTSLHLKDGNANDFNPTSYSQFRTWLLSANATNMAYMLSAQLAAMALNVEAGFVDPSALIFAPQTSSANTLGFATVQQIINEANAALQANPDTTASGTARTDQEELKNALDNANNNRTFVQATPCAFNFVEDQQLQTGSTEASGTELKARKRHNRRAHARRHRR